MYFCPLPLLFFFFFLMFLFKDMSQSLNTTSEFSEVNYIDSIWTRHEVLEVMVKTQQQQ